MQCILKLFFLSLCSVFVCLFSRAKEETNKNLCPLVFLAINRQARRLFLSFPLLPPTHCTKLCLSPLHRYCQCCSLSLSFLHVDSQSSSHLILPAKQIKHRIQSSHRTFFFSQYVLVSSTLFRRHPSL